MRRHATRSLRNLTSGAVLLIACASPLHGQQAEAKELLARGLHLADLYNWADAAPLFTQAEELFAAAGDRRNALYAKLGRIRSNIEREQQTLPMVSAQLEESLDDDPLLQADKELRMFCLIVKGDIDTETNTAAMRQDWVQVQALAQQLGDVKWQYRALAQLGIAAFYDADLETARKNVGSALAAAEKAGDVGSQIRFLTILTNALLQAKMYQQALAYAENAIKMAVAVPDAGYQFPAQELLIEALIGLARYDAAQGEADELLKRAREGRRSAHEATALGLAADIASARNDRRTALAILDQTITLAEASGLTRLLAGLYTRSADMHRKNGDLEKAERSAELAAASTQASGDVWAVPQRLQTLAQLQIARGRYAEADGVYDRAETFVDSMIGKAATVLEKTAVITASSQIYSEHFSLVADQLKDPKRAYRIIEHVRGRVATDLLVAGTTSTPAAKSTERAISQLRLKLMAARSTDQVRALRDQIFMTEQARWISPGVSVLKTRSPDPVAIEQVQRTLAPSVLLLEYVLANPNSYCLVISRDASRIVHLASKAEIEPLIAAYLNAVKAKMPSLAEARRLYDALIRPVREVATARTLVIIRDGQLHLVPFDALRGPSGYIAQSKTVLYSPSATTFSLLMQEKQRPRTAHRSLLAVGGIPYSRSPINKSGLTRGSDLGRFVDLPSSSDEVRIVGRALPGSDEKLLLGASTTETAFKTAGVGEYRVIHLAVHGFADTVFPDRAALVLLSDPRMGEDGFLQASEVVQLNFDADLVVLSSCDTAVGPLQGQEGIANLSRAFILAGARTVISTLWQVNDSSSIFLMKRFYARLLEKRSAASALAAAKRDLLRTYGRKAIPYQWAAFTIEGAATQPVLSNRSEN
ncbi:MAG: CHAT domain-containing protein [Acidobacteria bacterium]|nr:CHAT domain-containing protein [Acidobacteriota bacterium]